MQRKTDIKILSREPNWHQRGIRESIFIRGLSPSLNRNEGRHTLPHCYDSLIKTFVRKPDSPCVHSPSEPRLNTTRRGPGRPRISATQESDEHTDPKIPQESSHQMVTRSRGAQQVADRGLT